MRQSGFAGVGVERRGASACQGVAWRAGYRRASRCTYCGLVKLVVTELIVVSGESVSSMGAAARGATSSTLDV